MTSRAHRYRPGEQRQGGRPLPFLLAGLAGVLLFALCGPARAQRGTVPAPSGVLAIEADAVELDLAQETTEASGQARLSYGPLELHADRIAADRVAGRVEARGGLAIVHGQRRLHGEELSYDLSQEAGALTRASAQEQGVIIRGERIEFSSARLIAKQAHFTTCDHPEPHYDLAADEIILTAQEDGPGGSPRSGRLTLDRARVSYHGRRLLMLPRYSALVGELRDPRSSPFPASGFDREDGPYAQLSYNLGRPDDPLTASFAYRYTSFRGLRGHLKVRRVSGDMEVGADYVRREVATDRELRPDEMVVGRAKVMLDRQPEFRAALTGRPLGQWAALDAEVLAGSYRESEEFRSDTRAAADAITLSALLSLTAYRVGAAMTMSHALGLRTSWYSPGDRFSIRLVRHTASISPRARTRLSLSYVTRWGSGETPFLFDRVDAGRELFADLRWQASPRWALRLVEVRALDLGESRDMLVSATRTVHCLDYTFGWRKERGTFFVGIALAPLEPGAAHD